MMIRSATSMLCAGLAFSPDGLQLAAALNTKQDPEGVLLIWDAHTGTERCRMKPGVRTLNGLAFAPDGRAIACACSDGQALVVDLSKQSLNEYRPTRLNGHVKKVACIAYSPDGTRVATGGDDSAIKLWDPRTGEAVLTLYGHTGGVTGLAFSPDGRKLYSGSWDNTVRVWDATPLQ